MGPRLTGFVEAGAYPRPVDRGEPISYKVLRRGVRVESADGQEVGTVKKMMEIQRENLFDGIVIKTPAGDRFVDAPEVAAIYENLVVLTIDAADAQRLPKPGQNPGVMGLTPDDLVESPARRLLRRTWERLSGR